MRRRGSRPGTSRSSWSVDQHRALPAARSGHRDRAGPWVGARARSRCAQRLGDPRLVADHRLRVARRHVRARFLSRPGDRAPRRRGSRGRRCLVLPEESVGRADSLALGGRRCWRGPRDTPLAGRRIRSGRRALPSRTGSQDSRARRALAEGGRRVRRREPPPGLRLPSLARISRARRPGSRAQNSSWS